METHFYQDQFSENFSRRQVEKVLMRRQLRNFLKRSMNSDNKYDSQVYSEFCKKRREDSFLTQQRNQRINYIKSFIDRKNNPDKRNVQNLKENHLDSEVRLHPVRSLDVYLKVWSKVIKHIRFFMLDLFKSKPEPIKIKKFSDVVTNYKNQKKLQSNTVLNNELLDLVVASRSELQRQPAVSSGVKDKSSRTSSQVVSSKKEQPRTTSSSDKKQEIVTEQQDRLQNILREQINKDNQMVL